MTEPSFFYRVGAAAGRQRACDASGREIRGRRPLPSWRPAGLAALAWALLAATSAGAADTTPPAPEEEEGFKVHLGQSLVWDDNLFRLPDGQDPADGGPRSTRISTTSVGLSFDHTYSLQHVAAALSVVDRSYSDHSDQNATTVDGALRWGWAVGSLWSGKLNLTQREAPRSFADTLLRRERSINTLRQAEAEAEYRWHPSWITLAGVTQTASRYSDSQSSASEYDETAVEAGVGYRPATGNQLDLRARFADGDYINRDAPGLASGYTQRDLRLAGDWQVTGLSRFSGYVGYTNRSYSGDDRLNFSGATGRLVYDWTPTGKLALRTTVRRELGADIDEVIDNFVITRALSLEPRWFMTEKVTLWGHAEWLKRDLNQDARSVRDEPRTRIYGLGLTWQPRPHIELGTAYHHSRRSASEAELEYTDDVVRLDLRLQF